MSGIFNPISGAALSLIVNSTPISGGAANQLLYDNGGTLEEATASAGLSFSGGSLTATRAVNTQTGNYQLTLSDQNNRVEMNVAGANAVTVPPNATVAFPIGTEIRVTQVGTGATTIIAAAGVTGRNFGTLAAEWASAVLYKRGTDEWVMTLV